MKLKIIFISLIFIVSFFLVGCEKSSHISPTVELCAWIIEDKNINNNLYGFLSSDNSPFISCDGKELVNHYILFYSPCENKKVIHFDITREEYKSKIKELYPEFFTEMLNPDKEERTEIMKPPMKNGSLWKTWNKDIINELGLNVIDDLTVYKCYPTEESMIKREISSPPREEVLIELINENRLETKCEKEQFL